MIITRAVHLKRPSHRRFAKIRRCEFPFFLSQRRIFCNVYVNENAVTLGQKWGLAIRICRSAASRLPFVTEFQTAPML
ncbi:hypothetical protein [Acidocella facilis]|uniref:hypothetical protein n=1 Tax=Acidocella facilis TaxID=525 RepID=UPI001F40B0F0|nr:hypothetical protein [Acidocella facilis]